MRFRFQKYFSFKKFVQTLATILLGLIAFLYAFQTWLETAHVPLRPSKSGDVEVIFIHSGETKVVKANLRSLASLVEKVDCVLA